MAIFDRVFGLHMQTQVFVMYCLAFQLAFATMGKEHIPGKIPLNFKFFFLFSVHPLLVFCIGSELLSLSDRFKI